MDTVLKDTTNTQNKNQLDIINNWVKNRAGEVIHFLEEKVSGKINERPELSKAIEICKKEKATLLIAKLDRLSRNVSFLFKFDIFRTNALKSSNFSESKARSEGFELNAFGKFLDNFLHKFFPKQFSNLLVIIATKK